MGQQQSQDVGDEKLKLRRGVHGSELSLDEKIRLHKKELEKLTAHGLAQKREYQIELRRMDNYLYRKRTELHRLGERAKTHYTFWDYVKIVQHATPTFWSPETRTFTESESDTSERSLASNLPPIPPSPSGHGRSPKRSKSPKLRRKSKSPKSQCRKLGSPNGTMRKGRRQMSGKDQSKRSMILQHSYTDMTFTIFGFFEAYLLRRLHLALVLKNQSTMQRHQWNDVIVYCYDEIPATKRDTKEAKRWLEYLKGVTPTYQQKLEQTMVHLLSVQEIILYELRQQDEMQMELEKQAALVRIIEASSDDENEFIGRFPKTVTKKDSGGVDFEGPGLIITRV